MEHRDHRRRRRPFISLNFLNGDPKIPSLAGHHFGDKERVAFLSVWTEEEPFQIIIIMWSPPHSPAHSKQRETGGIGQVEDAPTEFCSLRSFAGRRSKTKE